MADPSVTKYVYPGLKGALFGNPYLLGIQIVAAGVVIVYSFVVTFAILKVIGRITPLRETEPTIWLGDLAIHGEVAYPEDDEDVPSTGVAAAAPPPAAT